MSAADPTSRRPTGVRGSALLTVVICATIAAVAAISVMSLMNTQRKLAIRKELEMHAVNAAESAIDYAYSMLINKISTSGNYSIAKIPASGVSTLALPANVQSFLQGNVTLPSGSYSGPTGTVSLSNVTIKVSPVVATSTRRWIDPADPANDDDPNRGQWIWETEVPLVASVTAAQAGETYTAYLQKNVVGRQVPMFQHAIFFQGQLQLHRSYLVVGPVHTNGTLLLNAQNGDTSVYAGGLTSSGHFYRGCTNDVGGTGADPFGYTPVDTNGDLDFSHSISPRVAPVATGHNRISIFVETRTSNVPSTHILDYNNSGEDSRRSNWRSWALQTYKGYLQDKSHQVPTFTPQGSVAYRQDVVSTSGVNEFSNGTYSLIEPLLPSGHASRKNAVNRANKLAARAGLLLRIERNNDWLPSPSSGSTTSNPGGGAHRYSNGRYYRYSGSNYYTLANEWRASNRGERFVVKGYKYDTWPSAGVEPVLTPVRLPDRLIGEANASISAVNAGSPWFEEVTYSGSGTSTQVLSALHDPRMGRPVDLLTLDMARLKAVLEGTVSDATAVDFRTDFNPATDWNGIVYIEMPTSITPDTTATANTTASAGSAISTQPYGYGSAELRHPDRSAPTDNYSRAARTDHIVPFAPELRAYPSGTVSDSVLQSAEWAIPGLQIINAGTLPNPTGSPGLTLATNLPVYLVGSYNSDGNIYSGTNITSTAPDAYATRDYGEVPAAIFCDTFTAMSSSWPSNRVDSFLGHNNMSSTRPAGARLEIAACIATGEYPIFEFFMHAVEHFQSLYSSGPPIVYKVSVVGMFKSEIQEIKQAYGRSANNLTEDYWHAHGAYAIPSVRYHSDLVNGTFPPGIPMALVFRPSDHRFLRRGNNADAAVLTAAGL